MIARFDTPFGNTWLAGFRGHLWLDLPWLKFGSFGAFRAHFRIGAATLFIGRERTRHIRGEFDSQCEEGEPYE